MGVLDTSFARLRLATDKFAKHVEKKLAERANSNLARHVEGKDADAKAQASARAIAAITPLVRRMLVTNLKASGIRSGSGALSRAVSQAVVWYSKRQNKIMVGFAAGISTKSTGIDRKGKKKRGKGSSVYVYGSSLNYGAVKSSSGGKSNAIGGKLKRTLKGIVLGKKTPTMRQLKWLQKSGVNAFQAHHGKSVGAGGFTFIKPRNFFQLSAAQSKFIAALFVKLVTKDVTRPTAKAA